MKNPCSVGIALVISLLAVPTAAEDHAKGPAPERQSRGVPGDAKRLESPDRTAEDSTYVIGAEDVLDISVWKEADFTRTVPVRPDGKISLPLLNDVQAAGLTPMQLAAAIAVTLRRYVNQPQVTVILRTINSRRVYVLGEINHPGPISMLPHMSVLQALSSAGGLTQFAKQKEIYVLRNEGAKQNRYPFNYKQVIRGELKQNLTLRPGDTIVVP